MPNFWSNGSDFILVDISGKVGVQNRIVPGDTIKAEDINEMRRFCEKYILHPCNYFDYFNIGGCTSCNAYEFTINEIIKKIWTNGTVIQTPGVNQFDYIGDSCNGYPAAKRIVPGDTIKAEDINDIRKIISFIIFKGTYSYKNVVDSSGNTIQVPIYLNELDTFSIMENIFTDGTDVIDSSINGIILGGELMLSGPIRILEPGTKIKAQHINECRFMLEKIYYIGLQKINDKPDSTIKSVNTV